MPDIMQFALMALNANPKFKNSPMGQQLTQCIQNNDVQRGEALANNIIQTYGLTREQATQQATQGIRGMFHI